MSTVHNLLCECPNCGEQFWFSAELELREGKCPKCHHLFALRSLKVLEVIEKRQRAFEATAQFKAIEEAPNFSAIAHDIRSLFNVGSIIRTADGAGLDGLYFTGISGIPPRKEIAKVSLGAEEFLPWQYRADIGDVLKPLKKLGVQIIALEKTSASISLTDAIAQGKIGPGQKTCLIVGNEVAGLSGDALHEAEIVCHLPMRGTKESLNVAVAFGVAAYLIAEAININETSTIKERLSSKLREQMVLNYSKGGTRSSEENDDESSS